jgi:hypothetical protein
VPEIWIAPDPILRAIFSQPFHDVGSPTTTVGRFKGKPLGTEHPRSSGGSQAMHAVWKPVRASHIRTPSAAAK